MKRLGACTVLGGTAAIILVSTNATTITNSTLSDVPDTGSADETGLDNELYVDGTNLWNNYIGRNAGPGVEFLSLRCGIADYNTNHSIVGNLFMQNLNSMHRLENCGKPFSGAIKNNLIGDSTFLDPQDKFLPLIQPGADNEYTTTPTSGFNAGDQFASTTSGTGWSYQTSSDASSSSGWTTATYTSDAHVFGTWTGSATQGAVSKFDQRPGSCSTCGSSRTWTAPVGGTIAIRSRVMKATNGGAPVTVTVQKNGVTQKTINLTGTDTVGQEVNANLNVNGYDVIRFIVTGAGSADDWTVWSPSIAYVNPATSSNGQLSDFSLETPVLANQEYSYAPAPQAAPPLQTPYWTFSAKTSTAGAGIAVNGSGFQNAASPDGRQVAFLQWGGSMSQTVSDLTPGGSYSVVLKAALRGQQTQTIAVKIDGTQVATVTPTSSAFADYATPLFTLPGSGTSHTLSLVGTANSDQTAFVDDVALMKSGTVSNGSFEQPSRTIGALAYTPTDATPWRFSNSSAGGAGIARNGSAFKQTDAPDGSQVGFVQQQGWLEQTVPFSAAATVQLKLSYAARQSNTQPVTLTVDGTVVGSFTANATSWTSWISPSFSVPSGPHVVRLTGGTTADNTAFIDSVQLQAP